MMDVWEERCFNRKRLEEGKRQRSGLTKSQVYRGLGNNGACWLGRLSSFFLSFFLSFLCLLLFF